MKCSVDPMHDSGRVGLPIFFYTQIEEESLLVGGMAKEKRQRRHGGDLARGGTCDNFFVQKV